MTPEQRKERNEKSKEKICELIKARQKSERQTLARQHQAEWERFRRAYP